MFPLNPVRLLQKAIYWIIQLQYNVLSIPCYRCRPPPLCIGWLCPISFAVRWNLWLRIVWATEKVWKRARLSYCCLFLWTMSQCLVPSRDSISRTGIQPPMLTRGVGMFFYENYKSPRSLANFGKKFAMIAI
jgi:hypothetical protein